MKLHGCGACAGLSRPKAGRSSRTPVCGLTRPNAWWKPPVPTKSARRSTAAPPSAGSTTRNTLGRCSRSCGPTASPEPQPTALSCWDVSGTVRAALIEVGLYRHWPPLVQGTAPQPEMKQVGYVRVGSNPGIKRPLTLCPYLGEDRTKSGVTHPNYFGFTTYQQSFLEPMESCSFRSLR